MWSNTVCMYLLLVVFQEKNEGLQMLNECGEVQVHFFNCILKKEKGVKCHCVRPEQVFSLILIGVLQWALACCSQLLVAALCHSHSHAPTLLHFHLYGSKQRLC